MTRVLVLALAVVIGLAGAVISQVPDPPGGVGIGTPPPRFLLTVTKTGTGTGTVTGPGITCGSDCTQTVNAPNVVTLTASPGAGSYFTGWSGACSGTGSCLVTMSQAQTVIANFAPNTLTVTKAGTGGGTVTSAPAGINCGADCTENYTVDTSVTLSQSAVVGSTFTGWSGACSGAGACVVIMSQAKTATATFTITSGFNLTVTKAGSGIGTVTSVPAGINCGSDCTELYTADTSVTLTAAASGGSTFVGWSGAGCSGTSTCVVVMNQAQSVTATFNAIPIAGCTVTVNADYASVNTAVQASNSGDTVCVNAGTVTWASTLTVASKSITLRGAGVGLTNITSTGNGRIISWSTIATGNTPTGYTRITGFQFATSVACSAGGRWPVMLSIGGVSQNFRFDNNRINTSNSCHGIYINGPYGVAHNNVFLTPAGGPHANINELTAMGGSTVDGQGHVSWGSNSSMGTAQSMYWEDNTYQSTSSGYTYYNDGLRGQRTVYRFNNIASAAGSFQDHGLDSGSRSHRHREVYNNRSGTGATSFRDGTGLVFNNSIVNPNGGASAYGTAINNYRSYEKTAANPESVNTYGWGHCGVYPITSLTCTASPLTATVQTAITGFGLADRSACDVFDATRPHFNRTGVKCLNAGAGRFTYPVLSCPAGQETEPMPSSAKTRNTKDGNQSNGHPCADQIGRGKGVLLQQTLPVDPNCGDCHTPFGAPINQEREPMYVWGNLCAGALCTTQVSRGTAMGPGVLENQDYFIHKTNFNGTMSPGGIGVGTKAQMNAITPTAWGLAFWVLDEGTWCTAQSTVGFPCVLTAGKSGKFYRSQGAGGYLDESGPFTWQPWYGNNNSSPGGVPGEPYTYPHPLRSIP